MPMQKVVAKFYEVTCDECLKPHNIRVRKFDPFIKGEVKVEFMKVGWDFTGYPRTICPNCKKKLAEEAKQEATEPAEKEAGLQNTAKES